MFASDLNTVPPPHHAREPQDFAGSGLGEVCFYKASVAQRVVSEEGTQFCAGIFRLADDEKESEMVFGPLLRTPRNLDEEDHKSGDDFTPGSLELPQVVLYKPDPVVLRKHRSSELHEAGTGLAFKTREWRGEADVGDHVHPAPGLLADSPKNAHTIFYRRPPGFRRTLSESGTDFCDVFHQPDDSGPGEEKRKLPRETAAMWPTKSECKKADVELIGIAHMRGSQKTGNICSRPIMESACLLTTCVRLTPGR
jgi:hypothetical protein